MRLQLQKQADSLNVGLAHQLDGDSFNVVPCDGKCPQGFHTTDGVSEIIRL